MVPIGSGRHIMTRNHFDTLFAVTFVVFVAFLLLDGTGPVFASGPAAVGNGVTPRGLAETKSLVSTLANVILSLTCVVLLLYLFVYLVKKSGMGQGSLGSSMIKVLETKMVAPKKYIAIVEIADRILSVGITDNNISLLAELDAERVREMRSSSAEASPGKLTGKFAALLQKATGKELSGERPHG